VKQEAQDQLLLNLLSAVERNSALTQRNAAQELGIALGLANTYLRRCVRKGFIKIQQVPANRYAYYLTAHGFSEKARLTAKYLSVSFGLFRSARKEFEEILDESIAAGRTRLALAGAGDLAEIALLCAKEFPVTIVGIVDREHAGSRIAGVDVVSDLSTLGALDAIIVTDMSSPKSTYDFLVGLHKWQILAPSLLGLSRSSSVPQEDPHE
jgi:hypothetical protein